MVDLDVGADADVDPIKDAQRQLKASVVMARWQHAEVEESSKNVGVTEGGDI